MKKRITSMLLGCLLLVLLLPAQALAANTQSTTYYEDGSCSVTTVKRMDTAARVSGTVTGAAEVTHYSSSGTVAWIASLTATFSYTGSSARCTSVDNLSVRIFESGWSMASKSSSKSGSTATGNITMRYSTLTGTGNFPRDADAFLRQKRQPELSTQKKTTARCAVVFLCLFTSAGG